MVGARIEVGQTILDRYVVLELIGRGGMANVWLARDERLGKLWAIKEIKPNAQGTQTQAFRQALVDEAHLMKRLDHPAIPRVVDIVDTGSTTFVVMDYVEGTSLRALQQARKEPFDEQQVIDWGIQLCDVLGYLHTHDPRIVYCDLKPSNVIAREDGSVRLIDFGIALEEHAGAFARRRPMGTPGYAAPEQMQVVAGEHGYADKHEGLVERPAGERAAGERAAGGRAAGERAGCDVDERADVYALGATLYTLVSGHAPQVHENEDGRTQVSFAMRPIRQWNPDLSEGLERIIAKATCAAREQRYASMREMSYDLEHHTELTQAWRTTQERKVARVKRRAAGAVASLVVGLLLLGAGTLVERSTYESVMYEARSASKEAQGNEPSDAERLLSSAIELSPTSLEPYELLLGTYEADYRLTDAEARRLQATCGRAAELEKTPGYARLCFDIGVCYLSYYGADYAGGSVGNAALASSAAAIPWFERAVHASEAESEGTPSLSDADVRAAASFRTIAGFYDEVSRASKEGRASQKTYRSFWDALGESLSREHEAPEAQKSTEGMRARLCQMAAEALSSPTYLAGFSRAGIAREEALRMRALVQDCVAELEEFSKTDEARDVYGPVFDEIREGLVLAEQSIQAVYQNPVAVLEKEDA